MPTDSPETPSHIAEGVFIGITNGNQDNEEHTVALRRAIVLLDAKKGTSEDKELDTLVNAIVAYENIHTP